jgi:hypothetical protein
MHTQHEVDCRTSVRQTLLEEGSRLCRGDRLGEGCQVGDDKHPSRPGDTIKHAELNVEAIRPDWRQELAWALDAFGCLSYCQCYWRMQNNGESGCNQADKILALTSNQ